MIRDGAPAGWSPLMRLVAGEIADDARDPGEEGTAAEGEWPWSKIPLERECRKGKWLDGLAERTGMSARAISRTLSDLAEAGYEMRRPITGRDGNPVIDKRGRLVFAVKGHALSFRVPPLVPREAPESSPNPATIEQSPPEVASIEGQRSPLLASKVAESGDPIPSLSPQLKPSPHFNPSPQAVAAPAAASVEVAHAREVKTSMSDPADFEAVRQRTLARFEAWMSELPERRDRPGLYRATEPRKDLNSE